jgi:hypothetical protein
VRLTGFQVVEIVDLSGDPKGRRQTPSGILCPSVV